MITWLKNKWQQLALNYTQNSSLIEHYWQEIETQYTLRIRHYHNLSHIYNMLKHAEVFKAKIQDYDAISFAVWYHDIIYKPTKSNNEIKSAKFASKRLKKLGVDNERIAKISSLIQSTKAHCVINDTNNDNAFLLDFDLSILGSNWETYSNYIQNIRKEYAAFPNFMYNKGRKKVLAHFLERERLYFTKSFFDSFENNARKNMTKEFKTL